MVLPVYIKIRITDMKKAALLRIAVTFALLLTSAHVHAQLLERAENLINTVLGDSVAGADADTVTVEERYRREAQRASEMESRLREMELEMQDMKLTEIMLRSELDGDRAADSLRLAEQRRSIDSLRELTPGVPVVVDGDTLLLLYAERGGYSAFDRAAMTAEIVMQAGSDRSLRRDSVYLLDNEGFVDIMYGGKVLLSVTDKDALWEGVPRLELAERYVPLFASKIESLQEAHSFWQLVKRVVLFVVVLAALYLMFRLTNYLFRKLRGRILRLTEDRLKSINIRDYELLNSRRLGRILIFCSNLLRYAILLIELILTVPLLFAIFPQTEALAMKIFGYILEPVKMVLKSVGEYIPNLFVIIVIWLCIRYIIKGLRFIANEIENEKLKISGFYPDWARPTFNIVRFLLYAFMIAMIYPYLPGSESGVFQGISVFVGLIVSLGSSTVIGNVIAGLVITYMRPYKVGDRIKLNDTTGNVIERTPFVTRLRTPKNEVVTIPNSFIMSSHTVNYSASAREYGLIIHTTVTIGYDAPWRQVHQLLINAARITPGVLEHPKPFVLETELQDYYPCYQINAYIKDADNIGPIMSDLHQNIQDIFNEAGVEIMSPHYYAGRDGNASTIPADYLKTGEDPQD